MGGAGLKRADGEAFEVAVFAELLQYSGFEIIVSYGDKVVCVQQYEVLSCVGSAWTMSSCMMLVNS